jgi:UTP--glucose-1-phosphate uridylyltransferase
LPPEIFGILENTAPGAGGEIQLTDAMCALARTVGMIAVEYEGIRYDMGDKLGMMRATVEYALRHPEIGEVFKDYLKTTVTAN